MKVPQRDHLQIFVALSNLKNPPPLLCSKYSQNFSNFEKFWNMLNWNSKSRAWEKSVKKSLFEKMIYK